jgi:hypothetical protein
MSSMSSISTNHDHDRLISEKSYIEDALVKLKVNYISAQAQLLDYEDKHKEMTNKIKELERVVYNLTESLKLKEDVITGYNTERCERYDICIDDEPNTTVSPNKSPKKLLKKQNSLGNLFKSMFKK